MLLYRGGSVAPLNTEAPAPLPLANTDLLDGLKTHLGRLKPIVLDFPS